MPGVLHHLYFAEAATYYLNEHAKKRESVYDRTRLNKQNFYLGNILPDLLKKKDDLHFKKESETEKGFFVPDLKEARKVIWRIKDPSLRIGVFAHLYLDRCFIKYFLYPQFNFNWQRNLLYNRRTGKIYTRDEFFSPKGLYYGYSELNRRIITDHLVDLDYIKSLPEWPPSTGVAKYDNWREKSWREELDEYLEGMVYTTDKIFPSDAFIAFVEEVALQFAIQNMYEDFC